MGLTENGFSSSGTNTKVFQFGIGKLLFEVGYLHAMTGRSGGGGIDAERRHAPASIKGRLADAKCLYFVDKKTLYSIFIADIIKKDLKNIGNLFFDTLVQQLKNDKIYLSF